MKFKLSYLLTTRIKHLGGLKKTIIEHSSNNDKKKKIETQTRSQKKTHVI